MAYILFAIGAAVLVAILAGCDSGGNPKEAPPKAPEPTATKNTVAKPLSREELLARLRKLQAAPVPTKLSPGALCYVMAMPPERVEYVCPACGERTAYAKPTAIDTSLIHYMLPHLRKAAEALKPYGISLEESQFCRKCSPKIENPNFFVVVKRQDSEQPQRSKSTNPELDLSLLSAFLHGDVLYKGAQGSEHPLCKELPRLQELLGVKIEEAK